jgi:type I restriction enzyme S subunit
MKRYDSYKDSGIEWIGAVPVTWCKMRLKNIGALYSGLSGKSGNDFEKEVKYGFKPFINFTNVANNMYIVSDNFGYVKLEENEQQNKVGKNDLFFLMSSENQEDVGKSALLLDDYDELYLNSFCKGFRFFKDIDAKFINYLLNSSIFSQLISLEGRGFTRINLRMEGVLSLPIIFPAEKEEQTQIANYLDYKTTKIDKLIRKKEQLIELLKEERTAIINQAVTKGLNPNVPMKDSGIEWLGEIPEHWVAKKIKYVATLKSGDNITSEEIEEKGNYPVYGGNGLRGYYSKYTNEGNYILIGRQGALCGNVKYVQGKFWASEHAIVCYLKTEYNWMWFGKLMESMNLNQYNQSAAQPGLAVGAIINLSIPTTSLSEQEKIIEFIADYESKTDNLILKSSQEIELLKEYKTALISEVVTGKVDVRDEIIK